MSIEINARSFAETARQEHEPKKAPLLSSALEAIKTEPTRAAPLRGASAVYPHPEVVVKTAGLWECLSRKKGPDPEGYVYLFKLFDKYNDITGNDEGKPRRLRDAQEQMDKLFPAIQNLGHQILFLDPQYQQKYIDGSLRDAMQSMYPDVLPGMEKYGVLSAELWKTEVRPFVERNLKHAVVFRSLGYSVECREDGVYLKLPDRETLLARWNKLRAVYRRLGPLDIVSLDGPADAKTFISLCSHGAVPLDSGKEFVHDHLVHVMATLILLLESGICIYRGKSMTYEMQQTQKLAYIKKFYRERLSPLKKELEESKKRGDADYLKKHIQYKILQTVLSAVVDTLTSIDGYESVLNFIQIPIENACREILKDPLWGDYLRSRFTEDDLKAVYEGL